MFVAAEASTPAFPKKPLSGKTPAIDKYPYNCGYEQRPSRAVVHLLYLLLSLFALIIAPADMNSRDL